MHLRNLLCLTFVLMLASMSTPTAFAGDDYEFLRPASIAELDVDVDDVSPAEAVKILREKISETVAAYSYVRKLEIDIERDDGVLKVEVETKDAVRRVQNVEPRTEMSTDSSSTQTTLAPTYDEGSVEYVETMQPVVIQQPVVVEPVYVNRQPSFTSASLFVGRGGGFLGLSRAGGSSFSSLGVGWNNYRRYGRSYSGSCDRTVRARVAICGGCGIAHNGRCGQRVVRTVIAACGSCGHRHHGSCGRTQVYRSSHRGAFNPNNGRGRYNNPEYYRALQRSQNHGRGVFNPNNGRGRYSNPEYHRALQRSQNHGRGAYNPHNGLYRNRNGQHHR